MELANIIMNIVNIFIAVLALIVAVIAIVISSRQANKSDKISLMGLRIDFYNKLRSFIFIYQPFLYLKIIPEIDGKRHVKETILSTLGKGNTYPDRFRTTCEQIINDTNYFDVNKYLFNKEISSKIDRIVDLLKSFSKTFADYIMDEKMEKNFLNATELLGNFLNRQEKELLEQIKMTISVEY